MAESSAGRNGGTGALAHESAFQRHVAFYLNGTLPAAGLSPVSGRGLRPALLARHRDLDALRYDFPLVLSDESAEAIVSLSGLFDRAAEEAARDEGDRMRYLARRLERALRARVRAAGPGRLAALWDEAAAALPDADGADAARRREDLARLRAAVGIDGDVVDCDRDLPERLLDHVWARTQARRTHRTRAEIDRLALGLADILADDEANAGAGLSAERLESSFGSALASEFDFGALSQLLTTARPKLALSDERRARVSRLLETLRAQRFFPARDGGDETYGFRFDSCAGALAAYRERLPEMSALAKAMLAAELEVDGAYQPDVHDALFEALGDGLDLDLLARFPDYLVCLHASKLEAEESARLLEALSQGLPLKVLLQTDALADATGAGNGHLPSGLSVRQLANVAVGMGGVFALQAPGSQLYRCRERLERGLAFDGPALFCVYSGADGAIEAPPYLAAAAALESRAFPAFAYDPGAGSDWAARFSVADNPQAERDWPVHAFQYEDEALQRHEQELAFTLADFLALDARCAPQLAVVPRADWGDHLVPLADFLKTEPQGLPDRVPYALMVDDEGALQRVLVGHALVRAARRGREAWHTLRELGGVRNSFAEQLLARERAAWEEELAAREAEAGVAAVDTEVAETAEPEAEPEPAEAPRARDPDEAYIETPRCSSCNECIEINGQMFQYDGNKQAFIADLSAGTYAELVLAAERCQVAVIHPGKPLNPDEPGIEELLKRAEPFR